MFAGSAIATTFGFAALEAALVVVTTELRGVAGTAFAVGAVTTVGTGFGTGGAETLSGSAKNDSRSISSAGAAATVGLVAARLLGGPEGRSFSFSFSFFFKSTPEVISVLAREFRGVGLAAAFAPLLGEGCNAGAVGPKNDSRSSQSAACESDHIYKGVASVQGPPCLPATLSPTK
jgi:hypothetical protein